MAKVQDRALKLAQAADGLFGTLPDIGSENAVSVTLVALHVYQTRAAMDAAQLTMKAPGSSTRDLDTGLGQLATWRLANSRDQGGLNDWRSDVLHMIVGENLSGSKAGVAYKTQICSDKVRRETEYVTCILTCVNRVRQSSALHCVVFTHPPNDIPIDTEKIGMFTNIVLNLRSP